MELHKRPSVVAANRDWVYIFTKNSRRPPGKPEKRPKSAMPLRDRKRDRSFRRKECPHTIALASNTNDSSVSVIY